MVDPFVFVAFFLLVPLFMGWAVWMAKKQSQKTAATIEAYAKELGLEAHRRPAVFGIFPSLPEVVGSRHGREVRIFQFQKGSGKNSQTWSALEVGRVAGTNLKVTLSAQGVMTKIRSVFGAKEIQVEEKAFNDRWFIETNDPGFLQAALYGKVSEAIDASQPKVGSPEGKFELKEGEVRYSELGTLGDAGRRARIKAAMAAAHELLDVAEVHAANGGRAPGGN